jgi:hypothetical protein
VNEPNGGTNLLVFLAGNNHTRKIKFTITELSLHEPPFVFIPRGTRTNHLFD